MWMFYFVAVFLGIIAIALYGKDNYPECNVPSVTKGHNTTLTCTFHKILNTTQPDGFQVLFYKEKGKGTAVLKCDWYNATHVTCEEATGYSFSGPVSDTIDLAILEANENQTGNYRCQINQESPGNPCEFKLKGSESAAVCFTPVTGSSICFAFAMAIFSKIVIHALEGLFY